MYAVTRCHGPLGALLFASTLLPPALGAQDSITTLQFRAFIDAYVAYDVPPPPLSRRAFAGGAAFTAQATKHADPNVNLALIDARLQRPRVRARVALQAGTAVHARRLTDPQAGGDAVAAAARHIHEATAGVRVAAPLWIDAGFYPSHLGMEGWISSENLTYTRSLLAEYAPIQAAGLRLTWSPRQWADAQLHVVNGWTPTGERSGDAGAGLRLDLRPHANLELSGFNLLASQPDGRLRTLHGFGARALYERLEWMVEADIGSQANSSPFGRAAHWWGYAIAGRARITTAASLSARFERFDDDKQIVLRTGEFGGSANPPFRGYSQSLGVDLRAGARTLWRTELRAFQNSGSVFPATLAEAGKTHWFAVSSLSAWF